MIYGLNGTLLDLDPILIRVFFWGGGAVQIQEAEKVRFRLNRAGRLC